METLIDPELRIGQECKRALAPREQIPIYEWAAKNVVLLPPITKTGPFDISGSRHFIAPFDALQNEYRREVNILKPVRGGGSLIGDIFCPWTIAEDPGPYLDVFQTDPVAKFHAETRCHKIFENCPVVHALYPADPDKVCNDQIHFTNNVTWQICGPSMGNLQSRGFRYLRLEEVWMWPQGRMTEALGRVGDYLKLQTSKVLTISQGGPEKETVPMEESDWYVHYHKAPIAEWEVQCIHCGKYFDPIFSGTREDGSFWGITWDKHMTGGGDWDVGKCMATVRFECPLCGQPSIDCPRTKAEWNRTGRYRSTATRTDKRESFHWETVIDFPWADLVELWLTACNAEKRGDLKPKVQFYQKRRAMFMDEEHLLKRGLNLRRRAYEINSDWPEERERYMSIDRQQEDMFWWTARAWSTTKSRKLGFGKAYGFAALETIREKFKVPPNHTFCDSRYLPKGDHGVYAACLKYGWIAVMGDKEYSFPHRLKNKRVVYKSYAPLAWGDPGSGGLSAGRRHCPLIRFSKSQMNQKVQELIDSGAWEEPVSSDDPEMEKEYNAQMAARVKKTEYTPKEGKTRVYWKESKNDHARDLANQQVLGAILSDLIPDPAMERLSTAEQQEQNK